METIDGVRFFLFCILVVTFSIMFIWLSRWKLKRKRDVSDGCDFCRNARRAKGCEVPRTGCVATMLRIGCVKKLETLNYTRITRLYLVAGFVFLSGCASTGTVGIETPKLVNGCLPDAIVMCEGLQ
jgi:hypothetical protein